MLSGTMVRWERRLTQGILALLIIAYLVHGFLIYHFSWILPYLDEWEYFSAGPSAMPAQLSWHWLIGFHNEHRLLLTRLQAWIFMKLAHGSVPAELMFNYLLYGLWLVLLYLCRKRIAPQVPRYQYLALLTLFTTSIIFHNHMVPFQNAFHYSSLLFILVLNVVFLFTGSGLVNLVVSLSCVFFLLYSLGAGIPLIAGILCARAGQTFSERGRKGTGWNFLLFTLGTAGLVFLWLKDFSHSENVQWIYPWDLQFWRHYLNLISFSFGAIGRSMWLGAVLLGFTIFPFLGKLNQRSATKMTKEDWWLLAGTLGCLAALASITLSRGGDIATSKYSRYAQPGLPLILFSVMSWYRCVTGRLRQSCLALLAVILVCNFANHLNLVKPYRAHKLEEIAGITCLQNYYAGLNPTARCPKLYHSPLADRLVRAKAAGADFVRQIESPNGG
jgi:hypothetical protein